MGKWLVSISQMGSLAHLRPEPTLGFQTWGPVFVLFRLYFIRARHCHCICMDLQARCPQWLLCGLPDGVWEMVSSICIPLMPSEGPGCCLPRPSPPPVVQHTSVFWMEREKSSPLAPAWQRPAQLGKPGAHSHVPTLPCGRNRQPRWSVLVRAVPV